MSERAKSEQQGFELDRRDALKALALGAATALGSCGPPREEIVPYVDMPERLVPGVPLRFVTALPLSGYARGVLVTSHEGRPTRIEGNPRHPASLGACDIFAQSETLSLYDPDRLKAVSNRQGPSSWVAFEEALLPRMQTERLRHGSKLSILTGRVTSPTLIRQLRALVKIFPEARWRRFEPVHDDAEISGAVMAFRRPVITIPQLDRASVIVALEADPLGPGPYQVAYANAFSKRRDARLPIDRFMRLYAVESGLTLTGANADERLALVPNLIRNFALSLANGLGATYPSVELPDETHRFLSAVIDDLRANIGSAIVLAGRSQPAEIHALCHRINQTLKAPVAHLPPVDPVSSTHAESLQELVRDIDNGRVENLFVIGCNPAYASPGELRVAEAIAKVPFTVDLNLHDNETARLCQWRLPLSHSLESWSDLRAMDGTASVVQPLIRPLYDTRTAHELVALISGSPRQTPYQNVRETWGAHASRDFDSSWRQWLYEGLIANSGNAPVAVPPATPPNIRPIEPPQGLLLTVAPDPSLWDGAFSNNAWLQECPKPTTKEVWGNALYISRQDADANQLADGDVVTLSRGKFSIQAPVCIVDGQAKGVVAATLGYGRRYAGAMADSIGFNAYTIAPAENIFLPTGLTLAKTGKWQEILRTQRNFRLEPGTRDVFPTLTIEGLASGGSVSESTPLETILPEWDYESYKWAMSIDNTLCIGCNACLIACQTENNVPIVGPGEIKLGRDMHWLRVDAYFDGAPKPIGFQPVPCMHCEKAPCEPVCPVEASVHDSEGLNVQVYNRCIGTRFCQSNCPYKVRRFNFFGYATPDEAYANFGAVSLNSLFNPDVTVRARGVMEKCTYCVQRISRARREAEKEDRRIPEGGVVTACQSACPTGAIYFGDLNSENSKVKKLRDEPQHYAMLRHLGTRPRTTYLAAVSNPNPRLGNDKS